MELMVTHRAASSQGLAVLKVVHPVGSGTKKSLSMGSCR